MIAAAAIQSTLAIQAQERLCSGYKRDCSRVRESRRVDTTWPEDVARMWGKKPSRYDSSRAMLEQICSARTKKNATIL